MSFEDSSDFPKEDEQLERSSSNNPNSNTKKGPNKFMVFAGMAVQMGVTIGLGAWGGQQLDAKYQTEKPYWSIALSLAGVFISLYLLIKQAKKLSDDA